MAFLPRYLKTAFTLLPLTEPPQGHRLRWLSLKPQDHVAGPGDLILQVEKQRLGSGEGTQG